MGQGPVFEGQRGCEGPGKSMDTSASHRGSEDQGVGGVVAWFDAVMADFFGIVVSKVIKPQAVLFLVHCRHQLCFQGPQLGCVQDALKDAVLHTLAVIDALFRNFPQPAPPGGILCVYIIVN